MATKVRATRPPAPPVTSARRSPGDASRRWLFLLGGFAFGVVIVALGGLLKQDSYLATLLFDHRARALPPYPLTISCIEWLVFGIGAGDMLHHYLRAREEMRQLDLTLLPEDEELMLDTADLTGYTRGIKASSHGQYFLQRILLRSIWQFQSTRSISRATGIMNATLELCQHELDLRYNLSRFVVWALPSIGFIGTVWGLSRGLGGISGLNPELKAEFTAKLHDTVGDLSLAFNTTMIALILSVILVLAMHLIQEYEEHALNRSGQYCIDHLINKLYVGGR